MKKFFYLVILAAAVVMVSCGEKTTLKKGNPDQMDSLSYCVGVNFGATMKMQYRSLPLNYDELYRGMDDGAWGTPAMTSDEASEYLNDYMRNKRAPRTREIMLKRKAADSLRLLGGDSTKVQYPVADPAMFLTEGERDSISYAFGVIQGSGMKNDDTIPMEYYWVKKGIQESVDGNNTITVPDARKFCQNYFTVIIPEQNRIASEAWLAKMEKKSGVKKTESGLLYRIIELGDTTVKATSTRDRVKVHYKGMKTNGKVFDASRFEDMPKARQEALKKQLPEEFAKDEPIEFPLNRVIKGWGEGMQLIGKGGKIELFIPSDLAYGKRGNRGIGGNEALHFVVELIDVTPAPMPAKKPAPTLESAKLPEANKQPVQLKK